MSTDLATRLRKLRDAYAADVIDAEAYEAGLVRLRREYSTDAVGALLDDTAPGAEGAARSATVTGQVGFFNLGDIQGHVFINGKRGKTPSQLLAGYLQRLAGRCGTLPLQGLREQRAQSDTLDIGLDQVYTQLATTTLLDREQFVVAELTEEQLRTYLEEHTGRDHLPFARRTAVRGLEHRGQPRRGPDLAERGMAGEHKSPDLERTSPTELVRLFDEWDLAQGTVAFQGPQLVTEAIAANSRLVLLGEPGSGKSTALRYLALILARAGLDKSIDPTVRLEGWTGLAGAGRLLPLFFPLLPFAQQVAERLERPAGAADLWDYLATRLEHGERFEGLAAAVHDELEAGNVLLMLDGLDEVVGADSRRQVVGAVRAFAAEYPQCRIVVSCRVRAYEGERNQAWQLPGWPVATLADWTPAQMRRFADAWYTAVPGLLEEQRSARAQSLRRAIDTRADLRRLGIRPLLMTIMGLVHMNDQGQLPEGRVALYSRCVDLLLGQWELAREDGSDYGALMKYIKLTNADIKSLRPLLEDVAYRAHSAATAESRGSIGANDLHMLVAEFLEAKGHENPLDGARKFLEYADVRAGLLQASDAGDAYIFPHQTFLEYLAGRALVRDVEYVKRIMAVRDDDRWRVPILLGVGHLAGEGAMAMVSTLLSELVYAKGREPGQEGRDLLLAAEVGEDLRWTTLERSGAVFEVIKDELAVRLARHVEGTALPTTERVRAGLYLADLGDPRPGVCTLPPVMVRIEGATFVIGSTAEEAEQAGLAYEQFYLNRNDQDTAKHARRWPQDEINSEPLTLPTFDLARYPVTNAQFKLFVDAGGYRADAPWWDDAGRAWLAADEPEPPSDGWRRRAKKDAPWFWDDEEIGSVRPNCPVVGVSWYEVTGYCSWLTNTLNDGYLYQLPSEAEWEYAVRGNTRRTYPWGEHEPDEERANYYAQTSHQGIYTTPVGSHPLGATPDFGLLDMAGNVLEWTRSEYRRYPYDRTDGREDEHEPENKSLTVRGGSWAFDPFSLRAAYRSLRSPVDRLRYLGFRLARRLPRVKD